MSAAFRPNPGNSTVEESFELSLERYGIQNCEASGIFRHFVKPLGQYEILYEIGELLASTLSLSFSRDKITWNPTRKSKDGNHEPLRAFYG